MDIGFIMPNLGFAIRARRKVLAKIHRSKEWKENVRLFKIAHPFCEWHLATGIEVPTYVPHHPDRATYNDPVLYVDLERSGCIAMCQACHGAVDHNLVLCKCGKHYHHFTDIKCTTCKDLADPQRVIDREKAKLLKKISDKNKRDIAKAKRKKQMQPYIDAKKKSDKEFREKLKREKKTISRNTTKK